MKSIIKTKYEKMLLTVNISEQKNTKLRGIMKEHGGDVKAVDAQCGGQQLGYLLGFAGFEKSSSEQSVSQECAVFSGIDGKELNEILKQMRECDAAIGLKAICTAYNQRWTLAQLADELEKEHRAMTGGGKD